MSDRLNVLSHELRSPVAALAAIAAAFHDADEAGRRRMLELASAACANIERLLRDASPVSLRIERLDAAALVRDAADSAVLSGAHVLVKVEPGLLVDADPQRLRQALDNLIGNAGGHSPAGGQSTSQDASRASASSSRSATAVRASIRSITPESSRRACA